jgi:hypothetical protein
MSSYRLMVVVLAVSLSACVEYSETDNDDFFTLFADGFTSSVNGNGTAARIDLVVPVPDTTYQNTTVPCGGGGEFQIVTSITTNVSTGYVDINSEGSTVPDCTLDDGTSVTGSIQLTAQATISDSDPILYINGSWSADGCTCTTMLSVSASTGWNGTVCGAPVYASTIQGAPSCQ